MRMVDDSMKVIAPFAFIHVPKSAGNSIHRALKDYVERRGSLYPRWYNGHDTSLQVIQRIGKEEWDARFSFALLRDPWSRQVSLYHFFRRLWMDKAGVYITFPNWVRARLLHNIRPLMGMPAGMRPQADFVTDESGEVTVDYLGRYESLEDSWDVICSALGEELRLPTTNNHNYGDKPWEDYYREDPHLVALVGDYYAKDVQLGGYSPPTL